MPCDRPKKYTLTPLHAAIVSKFWVRMVQIYGGLWLKQNGDAKVGDRYTASFLLWCEKTQMLSDKHWEWGIAACEREACEAEAQGRTAYPPRYPQFWAMCQPRQAFPEREKFARLGLEDQTAKAKRFATGREKCAKLLNFLDQ